MQTHNIEKRKQMLASTTTLLYSRREPRVFAFLVCAGCVTSAGAKEIAAHSPGHYPLGWRQKKRLRRVNERARDELQLEPLVHSQQQRIEQNSPLSHTHTICAFGNPTTRISGQISQAKSECIGPRYKIVVSRPESAHALCVCAVHMIRPKDLAGKLAGHQFPCSLYLANRSRTVGSSEIFVFFTRVLYVVDLLPTTGRFKLFPNKSGQFLRYVICLSHKVILR